MSWQDLIPLSELEENWVTPAELNGRQLAIYHSATGIHITSALCSHAGADLCTGYFTGTAIECPLHQALFDIATGQPLSAPATRPIKTFENRIKEDMVQIKT